MATGSFRSKKGFTVVQNEITRNSDISLKAKGLYLVIQANITMPGKVWRKDDFQGMVCEGEKAFNSAWNELKEAGYLKVHMFSQGTTWRVEYELLDEAQEGAHTFYYSSQGELTRTNIERAVSRAEKKVLEEELNMSDMKNENIRIPLFGSNGNGSNGDGINGNGGNNNKNSYLNTDNKDFDVNTSSSMSLEDVSNDHVQPVDDDEIKRRIEYDRLRQENDPDIVDVLLKVLCFNSELATKVTFHSANAVLTKLTSKKRKITHLEYYLNKALENEIKEHNSYFVRETSKKNKFNNFPQRKYDFDKLEKQLMEKQMHLMLI